MTPKEIKNKILSLHWERWLERPFYAFLMSLFKDGGTRFWMKKVGVNAEYLAYVFQNGSWYKSYEVHEKMITDLKSYLKSGGSIFKISHACEIFYREKKKIIFKILKTDESPEQKLKKIYPIFTNIISYIWFAHGLDDIYLNKLKKEVPKYYSGDVDKFIGDISFPSKKNTHALLEEALKRGDNLDEIAKKYAWIKARDGFSQGFTVQELARERAYLRKKTRISTRPKVAVPKKLKKIANEAQEVVYFRTLRTDVLYHFMYLIRPILNEIAQKHKIKFENLKYYSIQDLIAGQPKNYYGYKTIIGYKNQMAFFKNLILKELTIKTNEARGIIAFAGIVRGTAKIVKVADEINKLKEGDILIAPVTAPSFVLGMKRAAAFVTDEGGLTSHAAIVARELKKPCIIGTKIATQIFKDGNMVEVDANKGVVRILKN